MIEHLAGIILLKEDDRVVIEAGGVGYGISVPATTARTLGEAGEAARLWVKMHVTETSINLFGFVQRGEREVFEVLLGMSGVGPRLALAVLSQFNVESLIQIASTGDAETLKKVPGIGIKKAEKLVLELKGRIDRLSAGLAPERLAALASGSPGAGPEPAAVLDARISTEAARDAVAALEALDMREDAARRAIAKALDEIGADAEVEDLVREGLHHRHLV